jgi:predicted transcriptional regulator
MTQTQTAVLATLASLANRRTTTPVYAEDVAAHAGLALGTVTRSLKALSAKGLVRTAQPEWVTRGTLAPGLVAWKITAQGIVSVPR